MHGANHLELFVTFSQLKILLTEKYKKMKGLFKIFKSTFFSNE